MQISTEEEVKPRQVANGLFVMSLIARGNPLLYQRLAGHASRMAGSQHELVRSYAAMHLVRTLDISTTVGFPVDREAMIASIRQADMLGIDNTHRESIESFLASLSVEE